MRFFSRRIEWRPRKIILILSILENAISSGKNKQRKKSQKGLFESLSKNQNTSTSYERRQVLFLHDRETTRRQIITAACLSDIQINTNHKQLTTNTGYAAIHYSKSRRQYSSFPRSAKPAGGFEQFHNKLCMSF